MGITWTNIIYLILGAILGFGGTITVESIKRCWSKKDQERRNKNMLRGLEKEIGEGIKRCEGLIKFLENEKVSFSRIYTEYWTSTKLSLTQNINDIAILDLLYRIYYRFDLINFNMDHNRFGVGAAFAKEYIEEIKENFNKFKDKITKI